MGNKTIKVKEKVIGVGEPVYIIAEVGINHDGDMSKAIQLVQEAKNSGADAVKLQTYITEKRVEKTSPIFNIFTEA